MNRILLRLALLALLTSCAGVTPVHETSSINLTSSNQIMDLGNFSISLSVKDLNASRTFYEKLGFSAIGGEPEQ